MRCYVDGDLRDRVDAWIMESHDKGDADTAREYVEAALSGMLAQNAMYHAPQLSRGEDGFPEECSDCRHYGSACPVLMDDTETRWRERKLEEADSAQEARRVYQQQAIDVSCQRIPALLETWDNKHAAFIKTGQQLLSELEHAISDSDGETDPEGEESDVDGQTAVADGGEEA